VSVEAGQRLGPYEIVERIGAGGMGEVWRARDTRLERSVAVKILPAEFAENAQFRMRLEREARTISQLSHPHICALYDVGDGYLVMELLEGETLAERLAKGPLPTADVLKFGVQIAEALDKAHRAGIVHRDLKPGNVMLTRSGAKLLDFGLAKADARWSEATAMTTGVTAGPTVARPITEQGTILGTFQYMAPEQLAGQEADSRTDIFALGAVLYEMSTGKRAFDGKTKTSLVAAILAAEPKPISELAPMTPPALDHVIAKCLAKDPEDRWQSAHDIAEELRWIGEAGSKAGVSVKLSASRRHREAILGGLAALLALAAIAMTMLFFRERTRAAKTFAADLAPPQGMRFNAVGDESGAVVISPDGAHVVYSVIEGAQTRLWLRSMESGEAKVIAGTEGGTFPFWSPDSRNIAFFGGGFLKRVDVFGGSPVTLAPAPVSRGGTWGKGDVIVFAPATLDPLYRIPAGGGKAEQVTTVDRALHTSHRWPAFLPDGKHFVYLASNHQDATGGANAIYLGSIDGAHDHDRLVMRSLSNATYWNGYLLFNRQDSLLAQRMTADGTLEGEPRKISDDVLYDGGIWRGGFSMSDGGVLVHHTGQAAISSRLVWYDRSGKEVREIGQRDMYWDVELSPDQKKVLLCIGDPSRQTWIIDLERNTRNRVQLENARWTGNGIWSGDGSTVYVNVARASGFEIVAKQLNGGPATTVVKRATTFGLTLAPDQKTLIYDDAGKIWRHSPGQSDAAIASAPNVKQLDPRLSPNGMWITFTSNENGHDDVFVAAASDLTQKWQVSSGGGRLARWRSDNREIYYVDAHNKLTAVPVAEKNGGIEIGAQQPLFDVTLRWTTRAYDVSADGQRFLVNSLADTPSPTIRVLTNAQNALRP
jgi:Tol biopolymer transport system component